MFTSIESMFSCLLACFMAWTPVFMASTVFFVSCMVSTVKLAWVRLNDCVSSWARWFSYIFFWRRMRIACCFSEFCCDWLRVAAIFCLISRSCLSHCAIFWSSAVMRTSIRWLASFRLIPVFCLPPPKSFFILLLLLFLFGLFVYFFLFF